MSCRYSCADTADASKVCLKLCPGFISLPISYELVKICMESANGLAVSIALDRCLALRGPMVGCEVIERDTVRACHRWSAWIASATYVALRVRKNLVEKSVKSGRGISVSGGWPLDIGSEVKACGSYLSGKYTNATRSL